MEYSYKFRIYPNEAQVDLIQRTFGCVRFVYNRYLSKCMEVYEQTGETLNYNACAKNLTALKHTQDTLWLCEVDAMALQSALRDLDTAYQNFFRGLKQGKRVGCPKFKSEESSQVL